MIDPADAESVIDRVATTLAHRYWWLTKDDLVSEAWIACKTTNVLTEATSPGAFHERIKMKLIDSQKVEREWQEERIDPAELVDASNDGTVYTYGDDGEKVAFGRIDAISPDGLSKHVQGGRSRLLDTFASMSTDDFIAWADGHLGRRYAKKRDLRVLLDGSSTEQTALWEKYVRGKRDIAGTTTPGGREARLEDWRARYRWHGDVRSRGLHVHPLVLNVDEGVVVVARLLRQPVR